MRTLPPGWERVPLRDICLPVDKVTPADEPASPFLYIDIGSIDRPTKTIGRPQELLGADAPSRARQLVRKGDILFSTVRPNLRTVARVPDELDRQIASTGFCVIRPASGISSDFVFYSVLEESFYERVLAKARGVSYPAVRAADVLEETIALPPADEQVRIASRLGTLLESLLRAEDRVRGALAKEDELRGAILQHAIWPPSDSAAESDADCLVERIRAERRSAWEAEHEASGRRRKYKPPVEVLEPPSNLRTVSADAVAEFVTDGDHNPPPRVALGVPHLTAKNVVGGELLFEDTTFISEADFQRVCQRYEPNGGDVIVTCVGTIGRVAVAPHDRRFSPDRNLAALRPLPSVRPKFLSYVLQTPYMQERMTSASGSTAQPHLYLGDLRQLPVPILSLDDQDKIIEELDTVLLSISEAFHRWTYAHMRIVELRTALYRDAVAGAIARQDSKDEPAGALLLRIAEEQRAARPQRAKKRRAVSVGR